MLPSNRLTDCQTQLEQVLAIGIKVRPITHRLLVNTGVLRQTHGLMTGDSLHLGIMQRPRTLIADIVTHDGDFAHIPGLTVWQPMDVQP